MDERLKKMISDLRVRIQQQNKPASLIISAPPGKGKTTLAVEIADEYQGSPIYFNDQIANGFDDFMAKFPKAMKEKYKVFIYDEGGDVSKRRGLSEINVNLLRIYDLFRGYKILLIHIIQNFNMLDRGLLDSEVPRALLYIRERDEKRGIYSVYDLPRMYRLRYIMSVPKLVVKNKAYQMVYPNYSAVFYDLPPKTAKALYEYSIHAKMDIIKELKAERDKKKGVKRKNE